MKYFLLILSFIFITLSSFSKDLSDEEVCNKIFYSNMHQVDKFIKIAKKRNLSCGIKSKENKNSNNQYEISKPHNRPLENFSDSSVCERATKTIGNKITWNNKNDNFVGEANYRELGCDVEQTIYFDSLKPNKNKIKKNPYALALIIGIENYETAIGQAIYAENDSKVFREFAINNLGIYENNIKYLSGSVADEKAILLSVKKWLRRSIKKEKSDVYIFFAGHGLATENGKDLFLLPFDGSPELLEETSISRRKLFKDIKTESPRSVIVFLDTCYSGTTRGPEMLISSRPIMIKAQEQSIPNNFTVFSAAAGDQTSKPLEEAKHGMFSYFLMKGMEGDADANNDNKITARELHAYVEQNVVQQSSGSQTPELHGDKERILVQFN